MFASIKKQLGNYSSTEYNLPNAQFSVKYCNDAWKTYAWIVQLWILNPWSLYRETHPRHCGIGTVTFLTFLKFAFLTKVLQK